MTGFFERILGRSKDANSALKAKERLQFVLVHDRVNISPERMKSMKEEILAVISKYVNVNGGELEIALRQHDRGHNSLVAEVPFHKAIEAPEDDEEDDYELPMLPGDATAETRPGRSIHELPPDLEA
jgi:cell division topological specificity factor